MQNTRAEIMPVLSYTTLFDIPSSYTLTTQPFLAQDLGSKF